MINLFDDLPARAHEEIVTELLSRQGVRIERIVSTGQSTPADKPYDQDHDEWVLLLTGSAGLWIEGQGERDLRPGDHVLIPAHCLHRVTRTAKGGAAALALAMEFQSRLCPARVIIGAAHSRRRTRGSMLIAHQAPCSGGEDSR